MLTSRSLCVSALLLASAGSTVFAQTAPPPPTLRDTVQALTVPLASGPAGEAIGLATALEVANTPFGSSAGGFVFELDPTTGVRVRTAPTFGPAFAERALTAGAGKISFGASLSVATYDKLNTFDLKEMRLAASDGPLPENRETGFASFVLTSETLVVSAAIGATDKFDISVSVPFVKVKLDGLAWLVEDGRDIVARQPGFIESSGIGDVAIGGKYRLLRFGEGQPDPGGIAVQLLTRVPTGQRDNFRGLGITRVLGSLLFSSGRGKFRPHANVGFDWWEKALEVPVDFSEQTRVGARHQIQYALGTEFQAGPKLTLLADTRKLYTTEQFTAGVARGDDSLKSFADRRRAYLLKTVK